MSKRNVAFATTVHIRDTCLCLHVQRAARTLARRFDDALRPLGLTHGQFSLLNALNRPNASTMRSLSSLLAMDRTTLTAVLKPLEREALVTITLSKTDKRARLVALTSAGKRRLALAVPVWKRTHADLPDGNRLRAELHELSAM